MATAARAHGIPRSTLASHVTGRSKSTKRGLDTNFNSTRGACFGDLYGTNGRSWGHGLPLTTKQFKLKVALLSQERATPFLNGIPGYRWLRWFQKRHPILTARQSQGLEVSRATGLCAENVATFYKNLQELYEKYKYPPENI